MNTGTEVIRGNMVGILDEMIAVAEALRVAVIKAQLDQATTWWDIWSVTQHTMLGPLS